MKHLINIVVLGGLLSASVWAYSSGPDPQLTGAPGEGNCTQCHNSFAVNSGPGNVRVELINATTYTPGAEHKLRITLTDPTASRWGFELSARLTGTSTKAGALALDNATDTRIEESGGLQYVSHTQAGTRAGSTASVTWEVKWTAPAAGAGNVSFYVSGNAANRNGNPSGDQIYTASLLAAPGAGDPLTKSYALSQIAFGGNPATEGRWATSLYFTNSGLQTANFTVDFRKNDGTAMPVTTPVGNGASLPVTIASGGTAQIPITGTGDLTQGWASVKLPAGVSGFGIFKQSVTGREDQEAVVPLGDDSKTSYVLIWDDTGFSTVMAVANPEDSAATVNMTVRDASGAQLGSGTLNLGPKQKAAFVIRTQLGLPQMVNSRGSMDITATTGKIAVLGLRFGPVAFTSIPPSEK